MHDDAKSAVAIILAVGSMIAIISLAIAWPICYYTTRTTERAMEMGYEEGPILGRNGTGWVKKK